MSEEAMQAEQIADIKGRLKLLQDAAEAIADTRTIDAEDRAEAISAARRLEQELENLGMADAAAHARDVVSTLDHAGLPQPERLQKVVEALSDSLTSVAETDA